MTTRHIWAYTGSNMLDCNTCIKKQQQQYWDKRQTPQRKKNAGTERKSRPHNLHCVLPEQYKHAVYVYMRIWVSKKTMVYWPSANVDRTQRTFAIPPKKKTSVIDQNHIVVFLLPPNLSLYFWSYNAKHWVTFNITFIARSFSITIFFKIIPPKHSLLLVHTKQYNLYIDFTSFFVFASMIFRFLYVCPWSMCGFINKTVSAI